MRRNLLTLLTALLLLTSIATAALWVRSHRVGELLMHDAFKRDALPYVLTSTWLYLDSGGVGFIRTRSVCSANSPAEAREWFELYFRDHPPGWTRNRHDPWGYPKVNSTAAPAFDHLGVVVSREPWPGMGGQNHPCFRAVVPFWLLVALPAVPALVAARRRWRSRTRLRAGRCVACGYDLRATPGRCPECGKGVLASR
jgi:hypothetical protein